MGKATKKWIIDTDIGDDIDDAFALQYAVRAGLDIVAVTTVFRSCVLRAKLAKYLLDIYGASDIPVHAGCDYTLSGEGEAHQKAERWLPPDEYARVKATNEPWLPQYLFEANESVFSGENAVDAIAGYAEKHTGQLCILAIGPLTNIAAALVARPDIKRHICEIVLMGGNISENVAEWNVRLDAEAAYTVFHSGIKIKMIGSDMTWKHCMFSTEELERRKKLSARSMDEVNAKMLAKWQNQPLYRNRIPCMHDALAVAAALDVPCMTFENRCVKVELAGEARARTVSVTQPNRDCAAIEVAVNVEGAAFWRSFNKYT